MECHRSRRVSLTGDFLDDLLEGTTLPPSLASDDHTKDVYTVPCQRRRTTSNVEEGETKEDN